MTIKFLLDENVLGIDRFLEGQVQYCKIGDKDCPPKGSADPKVVGYAKKHGLVIVTIDDKLMRQCTMLDVPCVGMPIAMELAKKVLKYPAV